MRREKSCPNQKSAARVGFRSAAVGCSLFFVSFSFRVMRNERLTKGSYVSSRCDMFFDMRQQLLSFLEDILAPLMQATYSLLRIVEMYYLSRNKRSFPPK